MQESDHYQSLKHAVLREIGRGKSHLVFWGVNETSLQVLADLSLLSLTERVTGIVDAEPKLQGTRVFNQIIQAPAKISELAIDTLIISDDEAKEEALVSFARLDSRIPDVIIAGNKHFDFRDELFSRVVASCPVKSKAGGYDNMLIHIFQCIKYLSKRGKQGSLAEFGCFQCGTTVFIAKLLRAFGIAGKIFAFDTFSGYPARRSVLDLFANPKCEFRDLESVKSYTTSFPIELVQGDITDSFTALKGIPLIFTFFDTDNYSPTKAALELCFDQTVSGGVLAFDHFYSPGWVETIGERIAAREFFDGKSVFHLHGTGIFVKI